MTNHRSDSIPCRDGYIVEIRIAARFKVVANGSENQDSHIQVEEIGKELFFAIKNGVSECTHAGRVPQQSNERGDSQRIGEKNNFGENTLFGQKDPRAVQSHAHEFDYVDRFLEVDQEIGIGKHSGHYFDEKPRDKNVRNHLGCLFR